MQIVCLENKGIGGDLNVIAVRTSKTGRQGDNERVSLSISVDGKRLQDPSYEEMQCDSNGNYAYRTKELSSEKDLGAMGFDGGDVV